MSPGVVLDRQGRSTASTVSAAILAAAAFSVSNTFSTLMTDVRSASSPWDGCHNCRQTPPSSSRVAPLPAPKGEGHSTLGPHWAQALSPTTPSTCRVDQPQTPIPFPPVDLTTAQHQPLAPTWTQWSPAALRPPTKKFPSFSTTAMPFPPTTMTGGK